MKRSDAMDLDPLRDDLLVLVDAFDQQTGTATKKHVHRAGLLHRAFSVVLTREGTRGPELLLARRAPGKYHSSGLWANSCCSHPRPGEDLVGAATRRTLEELGITPRDLREVDSFVYRAPFENGITEYEYDHVFVATCEGEPTPDPYEVDAVRWVSLPELVDELATYPEHFAVWAITVLPMAMRALCAG